MGLFRKSKEEILEKANWLLLSGIMEGDIGKVRKAIENGADPNTKAALLNSPIRLEIGYDLMAVSALRHSISKGNIGITQLLLENGAEVNTKDEWGGTALMHAVRIGSAKLVNSILKHNPDLKAKNWMGDTALFDAIYRQDTEILSLLLKNGADTKAVDNKGQDWRYFARDPGIISLIEYYSRSETAQKQEKAIERKEAVQGIIKDLERDTQKRD